MTDWREFMLWWTFSILAAATVVGAKLGMLLFAMAPDPPEEPELAAHWRRRRRWLVYAELSALPAFATIAVTLTAHGNLEPIMSVLLSMGLGGVGFVLLLDAVQWLFRKRIGMPQPIAPPGGGEPHA